jgi:hypothetical protein
VTWLPALPPQHSGGVVGTGPFAELGRQVPARPGWQEGGKIVLRLEGAGSRTAASRDASAREAPRLELAYRLP